MKKLLAILMLFCVIGGAFAQTSGPREPSFRLLLSPTIQPSYFSGLLEYRDGYTCVRDDDRSYLLLLPKANSLVLDVVTTSKIEVYGWLLAEPKLQIVVDRVLVNGLPMLGVHTWDSYWVFRPLFSFPSP